MSHESKSKQAASGAMALTRAAQTLNHFRLAAETSHRSVEVLESLCQGLAATLAQLAEALKTPTLEVALDRDLRGSVHDAVDTCIQSVSRLDAELSPLRDRGTQDWKVAWHTFQRRFEGPDLGAIVSEMKSHSIKLQMALQIVSCVIVESIPSAARTDGNPRFDRLRSMIDLLDEVMHDSCDRAAPESNIRVAPDVTTDQTLRKLYQSAQAIVTVMHGAIPVSAGNLDSREWRTRSMAFEDFTIAIPTSPTFSDLASEPPYASGSLVDVHDGLIYSQAALIEDIRRTEVAKIHESSNDMFDGAHYFDMADSSFKRGMAFLESKQYGEAREYLKRGFARTMHLVAEQAKGLDLPRMHYAYASCCVAESSLLEAELSFRLVVDCNEAGEAYARLRCLAYFQLAKVQLQLQKLQSAESSCAMALSLTRREKSLGKTCQEYYECLRLLALIYWEKGDRIDARTCSDLLPKEQQINDDAFEAELETLLGVHYLRSSASRSQSGGTIELPVVAARHNEAPSDDDKEVVKSFKRISLRTMTLNPNATQRQASVSTAGGHLTASPNELAAAQAIIKRKGFSKKTGVNRGLRFAAEQGHLAVLQELLKPPHVHHADVDAHEGLLNRTFDTPLILAASRGHLAVCRELLEAGATVDLRVKGKTALESAIVANHLEVCRLLLDFGACYQCSEGQDVSPLTLAAENGRFAICQLLRARGADINDEAFERTKSQRTALMQAGRTSNLPAIRWLLSMDALVDGPKPSVSTPLIEAARLSQLEAVALLLRRGADPKLRTAFGVTASDVSESVWLNRYIREYPAWRDSTPPEYLVPKPD